MNISSGLATWIRFAFAPTPASTTSTAPSPRLTPVSRWSIHESLFSSASRDGIIGSDLVYEHVHMTPMGSYLFARAIYGQVAGKLASGPVADAPSETECERMLALTAYDRSRIAQEMLRRIQRAPFTQQLNHPEQVLRFQLQAESMNETPNDTRLAVPVGDCARAP